MTSESTFSRFTDLLKGVPIPASNGEVQIQLVSELFDSSSYKYTNQVSASLQSTKVAAEKDAATPSPDGPVQFFEGAEHTFLGNSIELTMADGSTSAAGSYNFSMSNGASLTYGQILALGGDFYGVPNSPICRGGVPVFISAFNSLDTANTTELSNILSVMDSEIDLASQAYLNGENVADVYSEDIGNSNSAKWNLITGGGLIGQDWTKIPAGLDAAGTLKYIFPAGRYLQLANNNLDHFGINARTAYLVGHITACSMAVTATSEADLLKAYKMNAFADHFMSDLFAAGHLRTPRYVLQQDVSDASILLVIAGLVFVNPALAAGLAALVIAMKYVGGYENGVIGNMLSKSMHDEDNTFGLNVSNNESPMKLWRCYGDSHLLSDANSDSMAITIEAIQASANDVYQSYKTKKLVYQGAMPYIPNIEKLIDPLNVKQNFSPLFNVQDGKLGQRDDLADKNEYEWTNCWTGATTLLALLIDDHMDTSPDNFPTPPNFTPVVNNQFWAQNAPWGPNWVTSNQYRYAVALVYKFPNYSQVSQSSNRGPWMTWQTIPEKGFGGACISLPTLPSYGSGWNIYRQFILQGNSSPQPFTNVGRVTPESPSTSVILENGVYYFKDGSK
ncbi:MAG: hypothetical protein ACI837_002722 [Crocinitomicaceae bacterium]|jgi:hypothetical protein